MAEAGARWGWISSLSNSRTLNASRNAASGVALRLYQIIMPFIMRTVMIYFMGVEYLGLNGLFTSVLQFLNLAELGVGSAMVYSMYRPLAEGDDSTVCALLTLYRRYYRIIGLVVLILGAALIPFLPFLIKGEIPSDLNLYALYGLYLCGSVSSYFLFAYMTSLLQAQQRIDVVNKVGIAVNTLMYAAQVLAIVLVENYYLYVVAYVVSLLVSNIVNAICARRIYPALHPMGQLSKAQREEIGRRIIDLFTAKLGGVFLNAGPTIVISVFLGLVDLAIYQNYYFVVQSVTSLMGVIFAACLASIGNSIVTETIEKNYDIFRTITFAMVWIIGFCGCCILCLMQPFMELWVGEELLLDSGAVVGFYAQFMVFNTTVLMTTFKDAAGIWHQDRFRPLVTSVFCLLVAAGLVNYLGIYAVVAATPLAQATIALPWVIHNLFSCLFRREMLKGYLGELFALLSVAMIGAALSYLAGSLFQMPPLPSLVVRLALCIIVFNGVFLFVARHMSEFYSCVKTLDRLTHGRLRGFTKRFCN